MSRHTKLMRNATRHMPRIHVIYGNTDRHGAGLQTQEQADAQQAQYRLSCTHLRQGNKVKSLADLAKEELVYQGQPTIPRSGTGINAAKRYVRSNGLRSFTLL